MLQDSLSVQPATMAPQNMTAATLAAPALQQMPDSTPWGPAGSVLLCLLPIGFLMTVTLIRRITLPCSTSLPIAAAMLAVIRLTYLSSAPLAVLGSCLRGLLEGITPLSVIYGAILLFEAMQHSKCLPWMMHQVKSLSAGQPLAEVFLIGWAFAYMISGVGGFNTPIALGAPMLASLGHDPLTSLLVVVILNTLASHMGSVGMAIWFGFKTLDLGEENIILVGFKSAIIVGAISFVVAPIAAAFLVPWRTVTKSAVFVVLSIASAVFPTVLFAMFSPEFPVLIGGLTGLIGTTLLTYYKVGLCPCSESSSSSSSDMRSNVIPGLDDTISRSIKLKAPPPAVELVEPTAAAAAVGAEQSSGSSSSGGRHIGSLLHRCTQWLTNLINLKFPGIHTVGASAVMAAAAAASPAGQQQQLPLVTHDIELQQQQQHDVVAEISIARDVEQGSTHSITHADNSSSAGSSSSSSSRDVVGSDIHTVFTRTQQAHPTYAQNMPNVAQINAQFLHDHEQELRSLATISAPASYWNTRDTPRRVTDSVSNIASYGMEGCDHLWEDAHSLEALRLPASLVGATIHHAGLSGVSSGAQRSIGLPLHTTPTAAAAAARTHHHHHHHRPKTPLATRQADIESAYEGSDESLEDRAVRTSRSQAVRTRLAAVGEIVGRTMPMWLTVLLLLVTRIRQLKVQAAFQSTEPSVIVQLGTLGTFKISATLVIQLQQLFMLPGVNWKYETLYVPCLFPFIVASVVTVLVYRKEMEEQQLPWYAIFTHAWRKMKGTFPALLGAMVLSELISAGGTSSPAFILGYYFSSWLGKGYLAVAGFLGALGSFISGSVMSGNMTFGPIQKVAAERIGVPVTAMLAVQVAGACAGKMMCMSNILSAKVMMNLNQVREGKVVRRTAPIVLIFVLLSQLLGLIFTLGNVMPDSTQAQL